MKIILINQDRVHCIRKSNMFSTIRVAPSVAAVEENRNIERKSYKGFDKPEELLRNLSPLLSLKIFGIYFENESEVRIETLTATVKRYAHRIYTIIVLMICGRMSYGLWPRSTKMNSLDRHSP